MVFFDPLISLPEKFFYFMKIGRVLKKHYLATIILLLSLAFTAYLVPNLNNETKKSPEINPQNSTEPKSEQIAPTKNPAPNLNQIKTEPVSPSKNPVPKLEISDPTKTINATFTIAEKNYPLKVTPGQNIYDALQDLNQSEQVTVKFKNFSGLGYFVDGINGINSDTLHAKYWIYYINDTKAQVGISQYQLKQNDVITWKYESAE